MASRYRSRRGSFGLQPRVVPDVTNRIIALAREYEAKRDQNIMDAWRNGGTFEGKKATDEMVLAYWRERMDGLDEGDPTYEAAKNQVMQLQYAIEQSKADLLHVQGKMSTMEYANFFLRWAKKVPKNSEFYRTLQKDAAQLIEQAKAKARAGAERRKTEAFNAFVKQTTDQKIAIGDAMTKALQDLSNSTGLSITGNGDELLALLTQNIKANPDQYNILIDTIRKADPGWDGQFTEQYFSQQIREATRGYELIADRAQKQGFVSAYVSASQGQAAMSQWGQNLRVWPIAESYSIAEAAFRRVMDDPNASVMDKQAAASAFSAALTHMANTPGIDPGSKTMIEADAQRLLGQDAGDNPSFGSQMLGRPGVDPQTAMQLSVWWQQKAEMDANPLAWAYAPVDASGQFDPTGRGPIGMVPAGSVQPGAQAVMVPGADGRAVMAMVMPHSVFVRDPNNPSGEPKLAGYQISYNVGGRTVQMWGYKDAAGNNHWSLVSPVAEGAATAIDNKGDVYITPQAGPATDPLARAQQLDQQLGTNITAQLMAQRNAGSPLHATVELTQRDKDGRETGSITVTYNNGTFTATQKQNTLDKDGRVVASQSTPIDIAAMGSPQAAAFSQSRLAAGDVPGVTWSSALQASVNAAGYTQTQDQINRYASDPAFQQAFISQTMQTLGITNPYDPRIASAWRNVTTGDIDWSIKRGPQERDDLSFPGAPAYVPGGARIPDVLFGRPELQLPKLPTNQFEDRYDKMNQWTGVQPQVLPGLGTPAMTPSGSPALTATPTATPGPTPSPSTINPTPTPMPTSITPTPSPTPTNPSAPTSPYFGTTKLKQLETL